VKTGTLMAENNERKICDAIARVLEDRAGIKRSGARTPEKDRQGAPVEYRFDLGLKHYALEHTIIEAFDRQIHLGVDFNALVNPIIEAIGDTLPKPGVYYVTFPLAATDRVKRRDVPAFQTAVCSWVRNAAGRLYSRQMQMADGERYGKDFTLRETPPDIPFELYMMRMLFRNIPPKANGRLFPSRFAPKDREKRRETRIQRALDAKCPKLRLCKEKGARSILILEDNDIALTNHIVVGDSVRALIRGRDDVPDEIFLVDTCLDDWRIWSLYRDSTFWPDEETADRYREVNPRMLDAV
jgi:hypothetical protein